MDDYTPLRHYQDTDIEKAAVIYPIKDAWIFIERAPLGLRGKSSQGAAYYTAPNPPVGAVFSYLFNDTTLMTSKQLRQKNEQLLSKNKEAIPCPNKEQLHLEDWEEKPYLLMTIRDEAGNVVRRLKTNATKGLNRLTWDLPLSDPKSLGLAR